jgi:hypothetical protein
MSADQARVLTAGRPLIGPGVAETASGFEETVVVRTTARTALEVDGRPGIHQRRVFAGQLELDIGVKDPLAGGAAGVSGLGAE